MVEDYGVVGLNGPKGLFQPKQFSDSAVLLRSFPGRGPALPFAVLACHDLRELLQRAPRNTAGSVPVPRTVQTADAVKGHGPHEHGAHGMVPKALHGISPVAHDLLKRSGQLWAA